MRSNIKRDPFETTVGGGSKSLIGYGGSIGSPGNAYIYNWNMLPLGQLLWEKELFSYKDFPPMQAPEAYNLDGILAEMKKAGNHHPSQ
jgi:arylsulfatase